MNKSEIAALVRFNFWANEIILRACEPVSADEFTRTQVPDPGWGSLRAILVHALDTEYGWRSVMQALEGDTVLEAGDFPDVVALRARWQVERAAWFDFVDGLSDESLNQGYGEPGAGGPAVWQTILHVVTHGIQHRSEAAAILTGCGHSPGELDFDVFLREDGI